MESRKGDDGNSMDTGCKGRRPFGKSTAGVGVGVAVAGAGHSSHKDAGEIAAVAVDGLMELYRTRILGLLSWHVRILYCTERCRYSSTRLLLVGSPSIIECGSRSTTCLVNTTECFQAHGFMELADTEYVGDNESNKLEGDRDHFVEDPSHIRRAITRC